MHRLSVIAILINLCSSPRWTGVESSSSDLTVPVPYCPPSQRYDVSQFPPRCLECPKIIPNKMPITRIATTIKARAQKFSPGLPQNETCGCWRAPVNQTVDVALNTSWIVSGLVFNSERSKWLKEFSVQASEDNQSFLNWGTYTSKNFTDAAVTLFPFPIRAMFFRVTIVKYANHDVNSTSGFPISAEALVSRIQPFDCGCPLLSNGSCCPLPNMTVHNDTCMWCMDPQKLSTITIDGCGKCKQGTFEFKGECVYARRSNIINNMKITNARSDGITWMADLNISTDSRSAVVIFLTTNTSFVHPCQTNQTSSCLNGSKINYISQQAIYNPSTNLIQRTETPIISSQFLQFDRGRYTLNMSQDTVRSWALCLHSSCFGAVGALFLTTFDGTPRFKAHTVIQPIRFDFTVPGFLCSIAGNQAASKAQMELHLFENNAWALRIVGIELRGNVVYVSWDTNITLTYNNSFQDSYLLIDSPPSAWNMLRVTDELNMTTLKIQQPATIINHKTQTNMQYSGISIRITYGFDFNTLAVPGDSNQIIFILAQSPQPIRLKRLTLAMSGGPAIAYTNSKGFILDTRYVLDLVLACKQPFLVLQQWILQAISILPDNPPAVITRFIQASCLQVSINPTNKAYWVVPARASTPRTVAVPVDILAEFA